MKILSKAMEQQVKNSLLCIDGDQDILTLFESLFSDENHEVLTACNSEAAFEILEKSNIGVVLCDHQMSEVNGIELLSEIKEKYPKTVRLLLTWQASTDLAFDAINKELISSFFLNSGTMQH